MKKPIFVLIAFLLVAAALMPVHGDIPTRTWLGTANNGTVDPYYDQSVPVFAYQEGTTAVLAVTVSNTNATSVKGFNVTGVSVSFDWGTTYTSTQVSATSPITLPFGQSLVFFINFTVPNVSNLYRHSYTITATYKFENSSGFLLSGTYMNSTYHDFVVYSADQAAARNLLNSIDTLLGAPVAFQSAEAKFLIDMALNETSSGNTYYREGNFTLAKQSYTDALNDINTAWSTEQSFQTMNQSLQTEQIQATIAQMNAFASFLNGFSTLWVLLGIGWVLLGIGYIIKWIRTRRPEVPAPAAVPA
ncbi:MAG TPA: hypothetical protein VK487_10495 [Candidatus Bathyarchaeia archaeon]|nr:hypothetical protein [Candidatus Bathyarchaeia archaeon]